MEAIQIAGDAASSALSSLHESAQTPENMAKIASSVFTSVFKAIEDAGNNGHGDADDDSEPE